jgi:hypothetical protein
VKIRSGIFNEGGGCYQIQGEDPLPLILKAFTTPSPFMQYQVKRDGGYQFLIKENLEKE